MTDRIDVDTTLLKMTPLQRRTLELFRRHRKWTSLLLSKYVHRDKSTANRRLHGLVQLGVVDVRPGWPEASGGSTPDTFFLTPLGARVVTRLFHLGGSYVEAPDIRNAIDNQHDLAVLEIAVRTNQVETGHAFERLTINLKRGGTIDLIPDVWFFDDGRDPTRVFVEVEQTTRLTHIQRKFKTYAQASAAYAEDTYPLTLLVVYPTDDLQILLRPDHRAAARQAHAADPGVPLRFYTTCLSYTRDRNVLTYADLQLCMTELLA